MMGLSFPFKVRPPYRMQRGVAAGPRDPIRAAGRGESVLPPAIASVVVRHLARKTPPLPQDALTPRETQVLHLLAQGQSSRQIARRLGLGVRTVEAHLTHIYAKLGVGSRTEAILRAQQRGLLAPP